MIFTETALKPAWLIDLEPLADERGFFARTFCQNEFARHGLPQTFVQSSISFNRRQGTLRGLHYQAEPAVEGKLVRCTRGKIFDVMVDLRCQAPPIVGGKRLSLVRRIAGRSTSHPASPTASKA